MEGVHLLFVWKLSVNDQEGGLKEVRLLSKLFDWISSVLKDTFLTIDKTDSRDAVDSVHVGWIKGARDSSSWRLDLGEVSCVDGTVSDCQLIVFAGSVIDNTQCVFGSSQLWTKVVLQVSESVHFSKSKRFLKCFCFLN